MLNFSLFLPEFFPNLKLKSILALNLTSLQHSIHPGLDGNQISTWIMTFPQFGQI